LGAADLVSFREEAGGAALPRRSAQAEGRGRIHENIRRVRRRTAFVLARPLSHAGRGQRDMRCPSSERVGAKPPPRAIATRGCLGSGREPAANHGPLTQEDSTLRSSSCLAHARVHGEPPQTTLATASSAKAGFHCPKAGVEGPTTVLADRKRWQKSTNGAWPEARAGDEPARASWSSLQPLTGPRGERASEAGPRRQSRHPVAGSRSRFRVKTRRRASIRRWKAPGRGGMRCL
jgi:hypothetical protein